jgi:hypothetical protein
MKLGEMNSGYGRNNTAAVLWTSRHCGKPGSIRPLRAPARASVQPGTPQGPEQANVFHFNNSALRPVLTLLTGKCREGQGKDDARVLCIGFSDH